MSSAGSLENPAVLLRVEARVGHKDHPAELPAATVSLDLLVLVRRVPRPDPGPDGDARPGHGKPDHHLGELGALVLAEAPLAKAFRVPVFPLDLEESARRVQEDDVDLEVKEVGHRGEDAELDLLPGL